MTNIELQNAFMYSETLYYSLCYSAQDEKNPSNTERIIIPIKVNALLVDNGAIVGLFAMDVNSDKEIKIYGENLENIFKADSLKEAIEGKDEKTQVQST